MSICHHVYLTVILQCSSISVPTICMVTTAVPLPTALYEPSLSTVTTDSSEEVIFDERGILGYRVELSDRLVINH